MWFDEKGKKTRVAAPQYIDYVMTFIQKTISDESIFPTKYGKANSIMFFFQYNFACLSTANEFPSSFESIVRKIVRLLFHVVAHLYAAHFKEVVMLGLHAHLNLTFAHLTALHNRFALIEPKETEVLRDLEVALRLTEDGSNSNIECGSGGGGGGMMEHGEHVGDSGEIDNKAQGDKTNNGKFMVYSKIWFFFKFQFLKLVFFVLKMLV